MNALVSAQSCPGLLLLGVAVLASLNLFYSDRREQGQDALHLIMTVMGRVMILTGFIEACLLFLNLLFGILFGIAMIGVVVFAAIRYWRRRQASLLAVMAASARRWIPLAPVVEGFASEWRVWFGWRCQRLAQLLASGVPLPDALRQVGWLVPRRALAMIETGARSGNLVAALEETTRQPASRPALAKIAAALWYLGALAVIGSGILFFVMLKIVPAYIKIFDDFDADLPPATIALIGASNWFVDYGWPALLLALLAAAGMGLLRLTGFSVWLPAPWGLVSRRLESAVVLRSLSAAAETQQSLLPSLSALAEHYPSTPIRQRLLRVVSDVTLGYRWQDALHQYGLIRAAETAFLSSAERVGNLPWALRELADAIERRTATRLAGWLQLLAPAMVLVAGAVVMFIMVALFLPLISLIEKLT
ncbi:MAG TPA: type II secretion system F family protein [Pirellulales bacterium]|nr:type II secretion system F family protein [Pirellulales bacterium]